MQSNEKSPLLPLVKLILGALLVAGAWWGWSRWEEDSGGKIAPAAESTVDAVKVGKPALAFAAATKEMLRGEGVEISEKRPGPLVLHFWGTWCGPCVAELPELLDLAKKERDIRVVAVAMDDRAAVDKFLVKHPKLSQIGEHMEVVVDPKGKIADLYQVTRFPETFLINRQFLVDNRLVGPQPWLSGSMKTYLDRIKEEKK